MTAGGAPEGDDAAARSAPPGGVPADVPPPSRPAGRRPRKPLLSARLVRHVLLPLGLTWAIGAAVTVTVANVFTQQAFDRSLLDDAYLIASRVSVRDGRLVFDLSVNDLNAVLFDNDETEFFAVLGPGGSLLAGHAGLHDPRPNGPAVEFAPFVHQGRPLRGVTLRRRSPGDFAIIVAQTTTMRGQLLQRLIVASVAAQSVLLLALAWWLRRTIRQDLAPLDALQQALARRDASDLSPLPPALTDDARSRDVERLGLSVNALLARIGVGVRAQQEFAGNVAHELRTPLAGIRALAEYGLAQSQPAVWREQLHAIVISQARASHLIDQLLALALADEAESSLRLEPVALDTLVRETLLQALPRADAVGVDLGASGLDEPAVVRANPGLVEGLLNNLLDNALRHGRLAGPGRRPMVTVELSRRPAPVVDDAAGRADAAAAGDMAPSQVTLSVIDNGPGLAPHERRRMMQRGVRGSVGERLGEGAGLGLAIVARYAEVLHARFELADAPGGCGLRASVVFPPFDPGRPQADDGETA